MNRHAESSDTRDSVPTRVGDMRKVTSCGRMDLPKNSRSRRRIADTPDFRPFRRRRIAEPPRPGERPGRERGRQACRATSSGPPSVFRPATRPLRPASAPCRCAASGRTPGRGCPPRAPAPDAVVRRFGRAWKGESRQSRRPLRFSSQAGGRSGERVDHAQSIVVLLRTHGRRIHGLRRSSSTSILDSLSVVPSTRPVVRRLSVRKPHPSPGSSPIPQSC